MPRVTQLFQRPTLRGEMKILIAILLMVLMTGCSIKYIMAECEQLNQTTYYRCHKKVAPVIEWVGESDGIE